MSEEKIDIKLTDLNFGSLFKIIFASGILTWALFVGFWVLLSFVSPQAIKINGEPAQDTVHALQGVPLVLLIGTIFSVFGAGLGAGLLGAFGRVLPLGKMNLGVRHLIIIILGLVLYGCSSAKELTQSCFSSLPRNYEAGTTCDALMKEYASLADAEGIAEAKKAGLDAFFSYMEKISARARTLRTDFKAAHDVCGVLYTASLLNEYQYFQQANPKRGKNIPHYKGAVYKPSKHATCRFSGDEMSVILTSSAILLRPRMDDTHLLAALSEHYQAMAGERDDIVSCPVTFMLVYLNASVVKSSQLSKVIAQKIRACLSEEPDPQKREAIITVLDNMEA